MDDGYLLFNSQLFLFVSTGGGRVFVLANDVNRLENETCAKSARINRKRSGFHFIIKAPETTISSFFFF